MFVKYVGDNMHSDYLHDYIESWGMFDVTITVGPIPDGSYEVRIGYRVNTNHRGITQFYLDEQPCGIPIDMRLKGMMPLLVGNRNTCTLKSTPLIFGAVAMKRIIMVMKMIRACITGDS